MAKIWRIAAYEFQRTVFRRSFLIVLLSVPLFLTMMIVPGIIMESLQENDSPIGYLDLAGVILDADLPQGLGNGQDISILAFASETEGRQALEEEQIQALFVVSESFPLDRAVEMIYLDQPDSDATRRFRSLIRYNLLAGRPPDEIRRAVNGPSFTIVRPDGGREFPEGGPSFEVLLPAVLALVFGGLLLTGSGTLVGGLVEEKTDRSIELLITTVSHRQLMLGKLIGVMVINLVQLVFWILVGMAAVFLAGEVFGVEWFQNPSVNWRSSLMVAVAAMPTYVVAAALLLALGATVVEPQEGQSLGPLLFMAMMVPLYVLIPLANEPDGSLAVILSLLPFTSLLALGLRSMLTVVPLWQVAAGVGIQTVIAAASVWLAVRAFQFGMLRYGQRLRLAEMLREARTRVG